MLGTKKLDTYDLRSFGTIILIFTKTYLLIFAKYINKLHFFKK